MKKEFAASLLTVSATFASPLLYHPQAFSADIQAKLEISRLQGAFPYHLQTKKNYRFVDSNGNVHIGKIKFSITSNEEFKPDSTDMTSEISGYMYFESSSEVFDILGEDGAVLLDYLNSSNSEKTYAVYSCSSSLNICDQEQLFIIINKNEVTLKGEFPAESSISNLDGSKDISAEFEILK